MTVRTIQPHDIQGICDIYNYYVKHTSVGLHEKFGFQKVAHFNQEIVFKFGKWIDVGCWGKVLT